MRERTRPFPAAGLKKIEVENLDPLPRQVITEQVLRPIVGLPLDQRKPLLTGLVQRVKERLKQLACGRSFRGPSLVVL